MKLSVRFIYSDEEPEHLKVLISEFFLLELY